MIDINDSCNGHNSINYSNVKHIKDNIYEAETKGNYFRLVTMKTMHPTDREFCSYDIPETLDKQYVLVDYHSYVEYVKSIIVFEQHISLQDWIQVHPLVIRHRFIQELYQVYGIFLINILFTFNVFLFYIFLFS